MSDSQPMIPNGTRLESREVLVDAETGRVLTPRERAKVWVIDYRARTGDWPRLREIVRGAAVGKGTAERAMNELCESR